MKSLISNLLVLFLTITPLLSYSQYCEPNANCGFGDYIDGVEFNTISNTSTGGQNCDNGGYVFNSNMSTSVLQGSSHDITLTPSTAYPQGFAVWIDFDQNEVFETDELVYSSPSAETSIVTGSIDIPGDALTGNTRMRVRCRYNNTLTSTQACTNFTYGETEDYIVNIVAPGPPQSDFTTSSTSSCSGWIQFENLSVNETSYLWNFGDGNTSTEESPLHQYLNEGTYTVSLITTNNQGNDTLIIENYITIDYSQSPVSANCIPETQTGDLGFGITSFSFNTINRTSPDASEGYQDLACDYSTTVTAGAPYSVSIGNSNNMSQNYVVYIDYNNDGDFNDSGETAFSSDGAVNTGGTITIPNDATLNTYLRLRVIADYDFNPTPTPCGNPQYGQAEDYAVLIEENTSAPEANFQVSTYLTCDGIINFTDNSLYSPTDWSWDFGDGNGSSEVSPSHTYSANGSYTVLLTVNNDYGQDTLSRVITVDLDGNILDASCTPSTLGYCCEYGITRVILEDINNSTDDGVDGYQDYSCSQFTSLTQGANYNLSINTGGSNPHDIYVWVDMNNDGDFDENAELIFSELNTTNPSGTFTLPMDVDAVYDQKLRMRITADFNGSDIDPCANSFYGQTEDYGLIILEPTTAPVADFEYSPSSSCNGIVEFADLSNYNPTSWLWNFGDGNTSTEQHPTHIYESNGVYSVSLTATNDYGSDETTVSNAISVFYTNTCDTIYFNDNLVDTVTNCNGVFVDNGGVFDEYYNNTTSIVTIMPENAESVSVSFDQFELEEAVDYLYIYDGPSTASPLIGAYTGWFLPNNGDPIASSGESITLHFVSDNVWSAAGFLGTYSCSVGVSEEDMETLSMFPNPTTNSFNLTWEGIIHDVNIEIYDGLGRKIKGTSTNGSNNGISINTEDLSEGVYYVVVKAEDQIKTLPLIITK